MREASSMPYRIPEVSREFQRATAWHVGLLWQISLNTPDATTSKGLRDRAILPVLFAANSGTPKSRR